jgi:sulfite exporter TauE/SafE
MTDYIIIIYTALFIGFFHTILGPDHYIPFIALSRSMNWSLKKTMFITLFCGIGHVVSSLFIGIVGIIFGKALISLIGLESTRGELAATLLLIFGFTYFIWGLWQVLKNKPHSHIHRHDGLLHTHSHRHKEKHLHTHENKTVVTTWVLFLIFVFGPCEPLIPLIMYPAAKLNFYFTIIVSFVFAITTVSTMLLIVFVTLKGVNKIKLEIFNRYSHALAGFAIFICGVLIKFFNF